MHPLPFDKVVLLFILIGISAFAASSETAFFSLNRFQLRRLRDHYKRAFSRIKTLLARPSRLLVLILLINEIVNINFTTHLAQLVELQFKNPEWWIITIVTMLLTLPLILLLGEITPKVIATKANQLVAMFNSKILIVPYKVLYPLLWLIDTIVHFGISGGKVEGKDDFSKTMAAFSEEDFVTIMDEGAREGTVNQDEREMITNVLEFDDSNANEVMTDLDQVFTIEENKQVSEVLSEIRLQKFSRVPIYQGKAKNIVGVLYVKSLLKVQSQPDLLNSIVKNFMTPIMQVKPEIRLAALFRRFKKAKTHLAACVDREGNTVGIVTMEDVLESIFGEIQDERDVH